MERAATDSFSVIMEFVLPVLTKMTFVVRLEDEHFVHVSATCPIGCDDLYYRWCDQRSLVERGSESGAES